MYAQMNFEESIHNFYSVLSTLNESAAEILPKAQRIMDKSVKLKFKGTSSRESEAELTIRELTSNLDGIVSAFDSLLLSIGKEPRYNILES